MLELIETRITQLKEAIVQSVADHNSLLGRLSESEWCLEQQKIIETEVALSADNDVE